MMDDATIRRRIATLGLGRATGVALALGLALAAPRARGLEAAPPACAKPENRQFDFWLGEWEVRGPKGDPVGRNSITSILGGCVIRESWQGKGGMNGTSLNAYDAGRGLWHQTWVDDKGGFLVLEGRFTGGRMVLEGTQARPEGKSQERITWEKQSGDRVRQLWESSTDAGKTWKAVFDGTYVRSGKSGS
jgi:hypothetical protein